MGNRKLQKLGARIKYLRLQKGITLEKLAFENDIPKPTLSVVERGLKNPRFLTLVKIAKALEVKVKDLVEDA